MRKFTIIAICALFILPFKAYNSISSSPVSSVFEQKMDALFIAICYVESRNNRWAWNKKEDARGIVQIREIAVKEVERIYKIKLNHDDAFEVKWSYDVFMLTMKYYNKQGDFEIGSRCWNGGGKGHLIPQTEAYWLKVKEQLDQNVKLIKY